jgi:LmbE family N-acetylglucosaminyl deacetylase
MEIFYPGQRDLSETTHLAVGAHPDDNEVMAYDGILKCFARPDKWFTSVVVTDGAGSTRTGAYAGYTDADMIKARIEENRTAAILGKYLASVMLGYTSAEAKRENNREIVDDIKKIITKTQPEYIYIHNLADKHRTHIGSALKTLQAIRELAYKPKAIYGCEVWRTLDWLEDNDKIKFNVAGHPHLESGLIGVFDSQIAGGKRYDLAIPGRRLANATYLDAHEIDVTDSLMFAMDLTPLADKSVDILEFVMRHINKFADDVRSNLEG